MTHNGMMKAANALLRARCGVSPDKYYFPVVYVVGDSPFFFFNAAKRHKGWLELENEVTHRIFGEELKKFNIEVMTIRDAWQFINKEKMPSIEAQHINTRVDQTGH